MHRAIEELFCRQLTKNEKEQIWKYFKSHCAYCNKLITRKSRHGHMDHLDCSANSGGNYIRNRVLACKECNGNEKREQDWRQFLKSKCSDRETFLERQKNITKWQSQFSIRPQFIADPEMDIAKQDLLASIQKLPDYIHAFQIPDQSPSLIQIVDESGAIDSSEIISQQPLN